MDLKIKKFYAPDGASGGSDDQDSTVEMKIIIDSKFRRETSNFKVNFDASSVDPKSEAPVLIKYIEKNLKPEELLGVVVTRESSEGGVTGAVTVIQKVVEEGYPDVYMMAWGFGSGFYILYYVPSTGALSLIRPYVEEEEGGEDDENDGDAIIVNPITPEIPGGEA